jgi:phosphomannomutase
MAKKGVTASRLRAMYPNYFISKNKVSLTPETDVDAILEAVKNKYIKQPVNTVDGVKIEFGKEWVHLRKSNTEPIIRIYCESENEATASNLANKIIADIREVMKSQVG